MATQTLIQLKYSSANSVPLALNTSEPAYSFVSKKLWMGTDESSIVAIGGEFYTSLIDANTSYATPGTIVTRNSTGGSNFNILTANTVNANNNIYAGLADAAPLSGATNPLFGSGANDNNYAQIYIRNINPGANASSDFVAYPDNGSDVSGWIDMGITSSNYSDPDYAVTGPNEGYLFMSALNGSGNSGNLVIATDSTGLYNDIVFSTGGFTGSPHPIAHFRNGQGLIIDAQSGSSSNITGALVVSGGAGIQGDVYADSIFDHGNRVITSVTPHSGPGVSVSSVTTSGAAAALTINNTGVISLSANSGQVTANASTGNIEFGLATTAVSAGTYGGSSQIPSFIVDTYGRLTFAGNNSVTTSFTIAGNTGTPDVVNGGDTLTFKGDGTGIVTGITDNTITFSTDTTVLRSNTSSVGPQTIQTDLTINGNLVVKGSQIIANTVIVKIDDSLIELAANNTTDAIDMGFYGQYDASGTKYAGLFRKAADKFYLFKDVATDPSANVVTFTDANRATLDTNVTGGSVSGLSANIAIADGGTNASSFSASQITYFDGTRLTSLANTGSAGTYANSAYVPVITTDAYGRVSSVTNTAISISTDQVTSGLLAIARGGANNDTYTTGGILQYDGSKFISLANTGSAGTYANAAYVPVITTDAYGRVSSVTNTAISISATQITSDTLGVVYGGTGSSSFNANGVVISAQTTTGALTTITGSAYQVLQLNASGIPTFSGLNGGTF